MMFSDHFWTSWNDVVVVLASAALMVIATIVIIRAIGLRSLSKMSSFDFVVTVALGSIIASVVASSTPVATGVLSMGALLSVQAVIALLRRRTTLESLVDNTPVLLMRDGVFLEPALTRVRVTRSDVFAKLREANVLQLDDVRAVILETTGDISVLHGQGTVDEALFDNVDMSAAN